MSFEYKTNISHIKHVILVSSGKGGVGKSTVAANLAATLCVQGHTVGVLDADIHGPSQNQMWGIQNVPHMHVNSSGTHLVPQIAHGVHVMSMASQITQNQAVSWRGPMVTMALLNMIYHTAWPDLDYLVVDMPPGTGDVQISICEKLSHAHVVIVTTPQPVALLDCSKGLQMFMDQHMHVLGIVENMSGHVCTACGHVDHVFGSEGGVHLAQQYGVPMLAKIPLQSDIRCQADLGEPLVLNQPHSTITKTYQQLVQQIRSQIYHA